MTDIADCTLNEIVFDSENNERQPFTFCGKKVQRSQTLFFTQILLVLLLVCLSIVKLWLVESCPESTFWVAILSSTVAYVLPNPKL